MKKIIYKLFRFSWFFKQFNLLPFIVVLFVCNTTHAQQPPKPGDGDRKEKIESMRIAFITNKLNLTPEEAKSFWPAYNMYENEMETNRINRKKERQSIKNDFINSSDSEVSMFIDDELNFRQNEIEIIKKHYAQFKKILPIKKVALLMKAEDDFKRELLKQLQERPQEKPNMKKP